MCGQGWERKRQGRIRQMKKGKRKESKDFEKARRSMKRKEKGRLPMTMM